MESPPDQTQNQAPPALVDANGNRTESTPPAAADDRSARPPSGIPQTVCYFELPRDRFPPSHMRPIGIGVQGAVCSVTDMKTGRRLAVKKLSQPFQNETVAKRAYRELKLMRLINHPNIIKLLYAYTPQKTLDTFRDVYIFSELMDDSLRSVIGKQLDHERISFLVYQMLCGIRYLHAVGIIHRDLKPSNMVVSCNCDLKILDFGLARSVESTFTMTQYVVTRHYRAPEIILQMEYDTRVDIWSIGCIAAELITGQVLFPGTDHVDQWMCIVQKLGTPRPEFIERTTPGTQRYIRNQPPVAALPFEEIFPDSVFDGTAPSSHPQLTNAMARDFLRRMLAFDPQQRLSVDDALHHPYINVWHYEPDFQRPHPVIPYDHSIDAQHLTVRQWKELLFREIEDIQRSMTLDDPAAAGSSETLPSSSSSVR